MARRSLRPQLNQIRTWVRQGRTDAWIAHQLEATVQQVTAFKAENELAEGSDEVVAAPTGDIDLRAEDDALIAEQLEVEAKRRAEEQAKEQEEAEAKAKAEAERRALAGDADDKDDDDQTEAGTRRRRRGRRGGRGRKSTDEGFEATFDHGEEGYGLWLDPAIADSPIYAEHWAGHRPVQVIVEADQIVVRRVELDDDSAEETVAAGTTGDD